jgi:carbon monoxide dehydrogenase subunit G
VADATYTTTTRAPQSRVWDFVQEMDNWGRFVTGYQKHEKQDERRSTWTLKGDVGVLSRTLVFAVEITEWNGPDRVSFTLTGVNEPMQGAGTFTMRTVTSGGEPATIATPAPVAAPRGALFRLLERFWRWLLGRAGDGARRDANATEAASAGDAMTELRFELALTPGGPMAPMIDAMIRPLMLPAAENLANRILAEVEQAT